MELAIYGRDRLRREIVEDLLRRQGLPFRRAREPVDGTFMLLVDALLEEREVEALRGFVGEGGKALFMAPEPHAVRWVGEELPYTFSFPYLKVARSEDWPFDYLPVLPPLRLVGQKRGEAWAHFATGFSDTAVRRTSRYPAVIWGEEGRGRWGVFLYDLVAALLVFHQGYEMFGPTGDFPMTPVRDGIYRSLYLFWRAFPEELVHLPIPSFHEGILLRVARKLAEDRCPIARLWAYPYPHTTCLILSGDSDDLGRERLWQAWERLERWGAPYTQFIMLRDLEEFSAEELAEWQERGIDLGIHYYHGGSPSEKEMARGLLEDREAFSRKGLEMASARGHSLIWAGWGGQVRAFARAGVRVDSSLSFSWAAEAQIGEGLPYRLFTKEGASPVWELAPTQASEDASCHDKSGRPPRRAEEMLARTLGQLHLRQRHWYQPLNLLFHPHYFVGVSWPDTSAWIEGTVKAAREMGVPLYHFRDWMEFWWEREKVAVEAKVGGEVVHLEVSGPAKGMAVALPARWAGKNLRAEGVELDSTGEVLVPVKEGRTEVRFQ